MLIFDRHTLFVMFCGHNSACEWADCSHVPALRHKRGNPFGDHIFLW